MKQKDYLKRPVEPVSVDPKNNVASLVDAMSATAFQGRNVARAVDVWQQMLADNTVIFFGLAGAMVPAGMKRIVIYLIENRLIDCLVSTGANLIHDLYETIGYRHWQGSAHVDDVKLRQARIDRIYDVFAVDTGFQRADKYVMQFARDIEDKSPVNTRTFFHLLGERLVSEGKDTGILVAAYKHGVPIYCPAISDSSYGIALAVGRQRGISHLQLDVVSDVEETARIVMEAASTGVVYVGGGTPKNFIQQTEVTAGLLDDSVAGHRYAVQITADAPHWGGLSGCTFEEAQSWGKIEFGGKMVTVYCDATIALPLIVTALSQKCQKEIKKWKHREGVIVNQKKT